jgi:putative acetyltransferase
MAARYPTEPWAGTAGRKDRFWVARDLAGLAVGCVALRILRDGVAEIKHLYVVPAARRAGVAGALLDVLEAAAQDLGTTIVLETGTNQPEALAFYHDRGYRQREGYEGSDTNDACSIYLERCQPCEAPDGPIR